MMCEIAKRHRDWTEEQIAQEMENEDIRKEVVLYLTGGDLSDKFMDMFGSQKTREQIKREVTVLLYNIPFDLIENVWEWIDGNPLTNVKVHNVSIVDVVGKEYSDIEFLHTLACFGNYKLYNCFPERFYYHAMSGLSVLVNAKENSSIKRKNSLQKITNKILKYEENNGLISKSESRTDSIRRIQKNILMLDLTDRIARFYESKCDFGYCYKIAENIMANLPMEMWKNVEEYIDGKTLTDIEVKGYSLPKFLKNCENELEALKEMADIAKNNFEFVEKRKKVSFDVMRFEKKGKK